MVSGGYPGMVAQLTPHVKRLKELHKDKAPHHYTIQDGSASIVERALESNRRANEAVFGKRRKP